MACLLLGALLSGCSRKGPEAVRVGSASERLKPITTQLPQPSTVRTVYVPVYSSIYWGTGDLMVELGVTVSVRNTSSRDPIVINYVRYYDSSGKRIRDYVASPAQLDPFASVEFVIQARDVVGGPGASFLVQWAGVTDIDEPIIEAVMLGQAGNVGFAFSSSGKILKSTP